MAEAPIILVTAFNAPYRDYARVALASIAAHADRSRSYEIYILHNGPSARPDEGMISPLDHPKINLHSIDVAPVLRRHTLKTHWYFSADIYSRLLIPDCLPMHERAIYFDSDMIFERDCAALWSIDLKGQALAGVPDPGMACMLAQDVSCTLHGETVGLRQHIARLGLKNPSAYINSGLMVMDLVQLRAERFTEKTLDCIARHDFVFPDQDAINIVMAESILLLDPRWNICHTCKPGNISEYFAAYYAAHAIDWTNPFAIHFTGPHKPLASEASNFRERFWHYARMVLGAKISPPRAETMDNKSGPFDRLKP